MGMVFEGLIVVAVLAFAVREVVVTRRRLRESAADERSERDG